MKSLFEQNGGTYQKQGDYLIPILLFWKVKKTDRCFRVAALAVS